MIIEGSRGQGLKGSSESPVCELETQILLAAVRLRGSRQGSLGFIEKSELGTAKKDVAEIERMVKALIKSLKTNT